ncbi:MAG: nucleoside deaminase [Treponema sp.]|nr:nucleoside deaminase [Treponema sp.]
MLMDFMEEAIKEAYDGITKKEGGPFGSVIVKDGKIVGRGHNRVLLNKDPTCHGEMEAIRDACKKLGTHDLSGCQLYTTAEPCPMCLGGILWANITEVFYGCTISDTDKIGFRDDKFYETFAGKNNLLSKKEFGRDKCLKLFKDYAEDTENKRY